jgi:UDP-4-amino-4,6-dideoxy-N-acetyl-beta-L-altrosamine transaminase
LVDWIPYSRQSVSEADIDSVVNVLRSDFLTQGSAVPAFEHAVATKVGAQHAVAVNSATSALHIACQALGLGAGDWLWTCPNTFVASANCGRYCGAQVDFVDIDPQTWNLSTGKLEAKLKQYRDEGLPLPKVVVPVHFSGQPTEQERIWELAREFDFRVLEDASHSIGAFRNGEPAGSCRWSDVAVFSFHPVKIITSGEGGMALTNDPELAWKMGVLRTHGITHDQNRFEQESLGPWYYEQQVLGCNYRMTDIQAALGQSQINCLNEFVEQRNLLARRYDAQLEGLPLQRPAVQKENRSSFHLYVIRLFTHKTPDFHRRVFEGLRAAGIGVNLHYMPVHLQPYYRELGFAEGHFPEAETYAQEAISLPLFPGLTDQKQNKVVETLRQQLSCAK